MTELERRVNELTTRVEMLELENSRLRTNLGLLWYSFNMYRLDRIEEQQSYWDEKEDEYDSQH